MPVGDKPTQTVSIAELAEAVAGADALTNPTTGLILNLLFGFNGSTWDRFRLPTTFKGLSAVTITTIATVWTPASDKSIRLLGGSISVSAAGNVLFEDNSAGAENFVWRTPTLGVDTPYQFDLGPTGVLLSAADNVLKATHSGTATITGTLYGTEE